MTHLTDKILNKTLVKSNLIRSFFPTVDSGLDISKFLCIYIRVLNYKIYSFLLRFDDIFQARAGGINTSRKCALVHIYASLILDFSGGERFQIPL